MGKIPTPIPPSVMEQIRRRFEGHDVRHVDAFHTVRKVGKELERYMIVVVDLKAKTGCPCGCHSYQRKWVNVSHEGRLD